MSTHVFIENNLSPIDRLAEAYGNSFEKLEPKHKLFILSVLALYLYGSHNLQAAIDELDPEAQLPMNFISLVEALEQQTRHDLLLLSASIANQLAWAKP